jgi:hypothetical protein
MVFGHCYCRTWGQNASEGPVNSRRQSVCLNLFGNGTTGYDGAWLSHLYSVNNVQKMLPKIARKHDNLFKNNTCHFKYEKKDNGSKC